LFKYNTIVCVGRTPYDLSKMVEARKITELGRKRILATNFEIMLRTLGASYFSHIFNSIF
jgi:hypothetical protein